MGAKEHPLERLGKQVAALEDRVLSKRVRLEETKREMVFLPEAYKRKPRSAPVVWAGVLGAAAAAAVVIWVTSARLTATVDGQSLAAGDFVSSTGEDNKQLAFSDGSVVRLAAHSGLRIRALGSAGAHVLLERGRFDIDIRHTEETDWQFNVGPYRIFVTGTRFFVTWKPEAETFALKMAEGTVRVTGPMIATEKFVSKGERLEASLGIGRLTQVSGETAASSSSSSSSAVAAADPTVSTPALEPDSTVKEAPLRGGAPESAMTKRTAALSWQQLAKQGKYKEALALAKKSGLSGIIQSASASELIALGDAARYSGDTGPAGRAYKSVRTRFARSPHASNAAFALGVMAFDGKGGSREALGWFRAVIEERSENDGLAQEASGRVIECLERIGDKEGAAQAARRYLARYPNGPHAALSRTLTE